jgi:hypothetical protein
MSPAADPASLRARRLLRWYPRPWRDRYGEEFTELLISDIRERPHSTRRALDVARGGMLARLADAGLAGFPLRAATAGGRVGASLGSFGGALGVFLVFGAALWSQVLIDWQWSRLSRVQFDHGDLPFSPQVPGRYAFFAVLTTGAMLALLVLAVLAALPVLATVAGRVARGQHQGLIRPAAVLVAALTVLFIGGRRLENNWLGTGGHHALIPSGLAAFIWASTLFVSSYWAHPAMFAALHLDQRVWMALSPFVLAAAVASAALLVRRARISSRVAMFEARLGLLACVAMAVLVAGDGGWIVHEVRVAPWLPLGLSVGFVNVTIAVVLALALAVAVRAARMALAGLRQAGS